MSTPFDLDDLAGEVVPVVINVADIAALVRALDDEALVALVAPALRARLRRRAHRRARPAMVRAPEPTLGDLGPLDDGPIAALAKQVLARGAEVLADRSPRVLPVVRAEEITRPEQLFDCKPLHATLLASACVGRQKAASKEHRDTLRNGERLALGRRENFGTCRDCALGRVVASRIEGAS